MIELPRPLQEILTDITVEIDPETVLLTLNRGRRTPRLSEEMRTAVESARRLVRPAAAIAWVRVSQVDAERVTLLSDIGGRSRTTTLTLGPHAGLMAAARIALISVGTIGDELDRAVADLNTKGNLLGAYFLDSAGVVALAEVGRIVRETAEATAKQLNWGVSPSLGPGTLAGWPLEGQRDLWALLNSAGANGPAALEIALSGSGVLEPHKSATGLIGLGAGYRSRRVGSVCGFCQLRHTCWRRRRNDADSEPAAQDN